MKIVIIEDERITAEDLLLTIQQADPSIMVEAIIRSVADGLSYFETDGVVMPDLIFSDIRLGDGLSFEVLKDLNVPVIFCTAYDEYALNAFKTNGIDYIMKPFTLSSVTEALNKYKNLTKIGEEQIKLQYDSIKSLFADNIKPAKETALLIRYKDNITPVKTESIAFFKLEHLVVQLLTFEGDTYYPSQNLEELERILGDNFFRVNRQFLINKKAIVNVASLLSRKLSIIISINVKDSILISKEKAPLFLKWLSGMSH